MAKKKQSARIVSYCRNSKLTEAWAVILGRPFQPDDQEVNAIVHEGKKRLEKPTLVPSIVLVGSPADRLTPPFWQTQVAWDDGVHLARIGHRYLSVHFLSKGDKRYETFDSSLKDAVRLWTKVYAETIAKGPGYSVDKIGFGYTNSFEYDTEDFDLSAYFRVNVGLEIQSASRGLEGLTAGFRFEEPRDGIWIDLGLQVRVIPPGEQVKVFVKTVAEFQNVDNCTFRAAERVQGKLNIVRRHAKGTFFEFTTDRTMEEMGIEYA